MNSIYNVYGRSRNDVCVHVCVVRVVVCVYVYVVRSPHARQSQRVGSECRGGDEVSGWGGARLSAERGTRTWVWRKKERCSWLARCFSSSRP